MPKKSKAQEWMDGNEPPKLPQDTAEENYFLALESILRWTNRQGYPHDKIKAIRAVASTALLRDEYDRAKKLPKTWTPSYLTVATDTEENS